MNIALTHIDTLKDEKLLTPKEVAAQLKLATPNTLAIWRCTKRYDLPYIKIGRLIRYRSSDIEAFIEKNLLNSQYKS